MEQLERRFDAAVLTWLPTGWEQTTFVRLTADVLWSVPQVRYLPSLFHIIPVMFRQLGHRQHAIKTGSKFPIALSTYASKSAEAIFFVSL